MSRIALLPQAFQDVNEWSTSHHPIYAKIVELIKDLERHPFSGLGKPAPLKHLMKGL
jgi:toxin YoeB